MKTRTIVLIAFLNFILSSTLLQVVRINGAMPNLCIIFSILLLVHYDEKSAYVFAVLSGVLQDVFLGRLLAVNVIAYIAVVYYASWIIKTLFKGNYLTPIFIVTTGTLVYHFVLSVLYFFFQISLPFAIIAPRIVTEVVYNCIIGFVFYAFLFKKVNGYKLGDYNA